MNTQLITLVLSLLGNIPSMNSQVPAPAIEAIYVSWQSTGTIDVNCPDPNSGLDPMGTPIMLTAAQSRCEGESCATAAASRIVMIYPESKMCHVPIKQDHSRIFGSMLAAGEFRLQCPIGQCQNWKARPATEDEVVDYAMSTKGWIMDHFPGGESPTYPNGVWQVWPKNERDFITPIATGSTALEAIAKALGGEIP